MNHVRGQLGMSGSVKGGGVDEEQRVVLKKKKTTVKVVEASHTAKFRAGFLPRLPGHQIEVMHMVIVC